MDRGHNYVRLFSIRELLQFFWHLLCNTPEIIVRAFSFFKLSLQASWNNCESIFSFFWAPCVEICPKRYLTHLIVWVHLLGRFSKGLCMYSIYKRDFQKCKHLFLPQGCPCQENGTTLRCPCTHLFWERKSWRIQIRNPKNKKELLPVLESLRLLLPIVGNCDDEVEVSRNIFHPRPSVRNFNTGYFFSCFSPSLAPPRQTAANLVGSAAFSGKS